VQEHQAKEMQVEQDLQVMEEAVAAVQVLQEQMQVLLQDKEEVMEVQV
jgi:hypothetical protein